MFFVFSQFQKFNQYHNWLSKFVLELQFARDNDIKRLLIEKQVAMDARDQEIERLRRENEQLKKNEERRKQYEAEKKAIQKEKTEKKRAIKEKYKNM